MADYPWRLVTFDIDGTLTTVHGWRMIAKATGREQALRESNTRFFAHQATGDEHLQDLLSLAEGLTEVELERLLEATPKLASLSEGVEELHRSGARVALLTHNPGYVCRWYCRRFGFDDFEGSTTPVARDGRIPLPGPVRADKRTGLLRLLSRHSLPPVAVVHVGDGWADIPVFGWTGGGVALNSPFPEVDRAAQIALRTQDMKAVVRAIGGMRPRTPVNDALAADEPLNT